MLLADVDGKEMFHNGLVEQACYKKDIILIFMTAELVLNNGMHLIGPSFNKKISIAL